MLENGYYIALSSMIPSEFGLTVFATYEDAVAQLDGKQLEQYRIVYINNDGNIGAVNEVE